MIKESKRPIAKQVAPGLIALGLVLFMLLPAAFSQDRYPGFSKIEFQLDTTGYDSLKTLLDYSGDIVEPMKEPANEPQTQEGFFDGMNTIAKVFFVLFVIGLLVLLIWVISEQFSKPSDKKVGKLMDEATVDQLEENLPVAELLSPLQKALAAGDYNLAVRILFLSYLKELIVKGHIEWRQDKTNGEYLAELRGKEIFDDFSRLTLVFERVWYGKASISRLEYDRIERQFQTLTNRVQ